MDQDWPAQSSELWPIEKITPYARNSRTHSDEQVAQIAASIREWGWTNPILVDEDGGLIAGHGRLLAARKLGLTQIPTMVAKGWSEAQKTQADPSEAGHGYPGQPAQEPMDLASRLDTRIRIERKSITRDPQYGTEAVTWTQFATVWAEVKPILPSRAERLADSIEIGRRPARIRIRYLADLTADMRVIIDNRIHQIISGPAVLGRREAMEIMVEELLSQGAAP